jgi:hypothetical protein
MYQYYTKKESYVHYLNCTELALAYGIFTTKEEPKPHSRFVAAILREYYREHPELEQYYYNTKKGMMMVWPPEVYSLVLESVINNNPLGEECEYTTDKGKTHYFQINPMLIKL